MARDLSFWKNERTLELGNEEIYARLSDGESIDGLADLPTDKILSEVKQVFKDWTVSDDTYFEKDEESFELMLTKQFARFDCYSMSEDDMNKIIDIMFDHGCPLYDSAIDVRFDG